MILFVDDMDERFIRFKERFPDKAKDAIHVLDTESACVALLQFDFTEVWLDHDAGSVETVQHFLGSEVWVNLTFRPVACMLAAMKFKGLVKLHSSNKAGRDWMESILKPVGVNVVNATDADVRHLWGAD